MELAIQGGKPVRTNPFPAQRSIGDEEKEAVNRVLDSGVLSQYLGCWHNDFYGGDEVRNLEKEWSQYFGAKHAIAVNSCTSGLYCAVGAIGVELGDEIIVSPYTMSASATAPLIFNAVPVFADIEEDYFCLDPESVEERITQRTKAIIVVDIFGLPYNAEAINAIAKKHGLLVIEDAAQAPGALYGNKYTGTLGEIGVYSLNYHKHIHCGEGGVVVTNDDDIANRVQLIRNHAEAVVENMGINNLVNMIGFNFRLPEMESAIARCQLHKLKALLEVRVENCRYLEGKLGKIPSIITPKIRDNCTHVFYGHPFRFKEEIATVSRNKYIEAVRAELPVTEGRETLGPMLGYGYVKPLYLQPLFQKQIAYGSNNFPFKSPLYKGTVDYSKGLCPVAERMHEKEFFSHELMLPGMSKEDLDDVATAFMKVWENLDELKE